METSFRKISLTQGQEAIVDGDTFEFLCQKKWRYLKCGSVGYAARTERSNNGTRHVVLMHRLLVDAPDGYVVDHINGDTLDNRRENLRVVTVAQNAWRQKTKRDLPRGIYVCGRTGHYNVRLMKNGVQYRFGTYADINAASSACSAAKKKLYGEFAPDE